MSNRAQKKLTGRHVLLLLLGFFGVMVVVNAIFVYHAVTSFRGEDVPRSYRQGLEYNETLETRRRQGELGWKATYNTVFNAQGQAELIVALEDLSGRQISRLYITATLRHPTDTSLDRTLSFVQSGAGRYKAVETVPVGQWRMQAVANQGDTQFKFSHDIWVK